MPELKRIWEKAVEREITKQNFDEWCLEYDIFPLMVEFDKEIKFTNYQTVSGAMISPHIVEDKELKEGMKVYGAAYLNSGNGYHVKWIKVKANER